MAEVLELKAPNGETQGFIVRAAMHVAQGMAKTPEEAAALKREMERRVESTYEWHNAAGQEA